MPITHMIIVMAMVFMLMSPFLMFFAWMAKEIYRQELFFWQEKKEEKETLADHERAFRCIL